MIQKYISINKSAQLIYVLFAVALIYHMFVILGIVPLDMAWGGNLKTQNEMYVFEAISICINILFLLLTTIRTGKIKCPISPAFLRILFWICVIIFAFNTIGNIMAKNIWEAIIFTPITGVSTLLFYRLTLKDQ